MKTVHRSMIQDGSSRVSTRILKRGPGQHLLASALARIAILLVLPIITDQAAAQLTILHSFGDGSVPNDGANPSAGLIQAPNGDFYGVTIDQARQTSRAAGTIFKMTAAGKVSIIHRFGLKSNMWASGPLVYDNGQLVGIVSGAAVFALSNLGRGWQFSIWHTFTGGRNDGAAAVGGLTLGPGGTLYGVIAYGGTNNAGTAYELNPSAIRPFSIVYDFLNTGYWSPGAALVLANDGNLYGSTMQFGQPPFSIGGIFRLTPHGQFTVIADLFGYPPTQAPLIQASDGNLYGTIPFFEHYDGSVFRVGTSCCFDPIYTFTLADIGTNPVGALVQGPNGNLYGVTNGTIFEVSTDGSFFKVLHIFGDGSVPHDGSSPNGGLVLGQDGNLYGTTYSGGSAGLGTIFRIIP
jgi:uncharacterized repeat protein (TIGR03803 family)